MSRNDGHRSGELSEFAVAADLVEKGCRVSHTHGEYKYDLVADWDDCLLRVQVKKANQDNEKPWKYRIFTDRYEAGEVDLFAGHIADTDQFFTQLLKKSDQTSSGSTLRAVMKSRITIWNRPNSSRIIPSIVRYPDCAMANNTAGQIDYNQ